MSGSFPSSSSNTCTAMEVDHPPATGDHCLSSETIMEASSGSERTTGSGEDVFVVLRSLLTSTSASPVLVPSAPSSSSCNQSLKQEKELQSSQITDSMQLS